MAERWFRLSLDDGGIVPSGPPVDRNMVRWTEGEFEKVLLLNPDLLGVADYLPICVGGTTQTLPDQAYLDDLGRTVVVEVKNERAGVAAMAQLIAYADHWRLPPASIVNRMLRTRTGAVGAAALLGNALLHLCAWSKGVTAADPAGRELSQAAEAVLRRVTPHWAQRPFADVASFAQSCWHSDRLPLTGAAARIVLIAPQFDNACIALARELSRRMVAVELVRVGFATSGGRIHMLWDVLYSDAGSEPTWQFLRRLWRHGAIRSGFTVNGWADSLNRESFSLSAKAATDVCLWFEATETEGWVYTVVPDGWHKDDRKVRDTLRRKLLSAVPDPDSTGRWIEWQFSLPQQRNEMEACAIRVADALQQVLVPLQGDQYLLSSSSGEIS